MITERLIQVQIFLWRVAIRRYENFGRGICLEEFEECFRPLHIIDIGLDVREGVLDQRLFRRMKRELDLRISAFQQLLDDFEQFDPAVLKQIALLQRKHQRSITNTTWYELRSKHFQLFFLQPKKNILLH